MLRLHAILIFLLLCIELSFVQADDQVVRCDVRSGRTPIEGATAEVVLSLPKSQADSGDYTVIEETFFESDKRGEFDIPLPDLDLADLRIAINVLRPGFEPYHSRSYELDEFLHPRFDGRTIQLTKLYRWRAQILGAAGKAAPSAKVRVYPKQGDLFSIQLPTETQNFTANEEGMVEVTSARRPDLRVTSKGETPLLIAGFDAEVASQQTKTHLQMTRGTLLRGNVKTASGKPIPLAAIVAEETSGRYRMHHAVAVVSDELETTNCRRSRTDAIKSRSSVVFQDPPVLRTQSILCESEPGQSTTFFFLGSSVSNQHPACKKWISRRAN